MSKALGSYRSQEQSREGCWATTSLLPPRAETMRFVLSGTNFVAHPCSSFRSSCLLKLVEGGNAAQNPCMRPPPIYRGYSILAALATVEESLPRGPTPPRLSKILWRGPSAFVSLRSARNRMNWHDNQASLTLYTHVFSACSTMRNSLIGGRLDVHFALHDLAHHERRGLLLFAISRLRREASNVNFFDCCQAKLVASRSLLSASPRSCLQALQLGANNLSSIKPWLERVCSIDMFCAISCTPFFHAPGKRLHHRCCSFSARSCSVRSDRRQDRGQDRQCFSTRFADSCSSELSLLAQEGLEERHSVARFLEPRRATAVSELRFFESSFSRAPYR